MSTCMWQTGSSAISCFLLNNGIFKISFLYFDGCPLAPKQLDELELACSALGWNQKAIERVDIGLEDADASMKGWGSPTILVDGREIEGGEPSDALFCRTRPGGQGGIIDSDELQGLLKAN